MDRMLLSSEMTRLRRDGQYLHIHIAQQHVHCNSIISQHSNKHFRAVLFDYQLSLTVLPWVGAISTRNLS